MADQKITKEQVAGAINTIRLYTIQEGNFGTKERFIWMLMNDWEREKVIEVYGAGISDSIEWRLNSAIGEVAGEIMKVEDDDR